MTKKQWSPTARRAAMIVAVMMTLVYLAYRGMYSLNLSGPYPIVASLMLYAAECYGAVLMFLYFFQIWDIQNPAPAPPLPGRTVDVMIPTYNEDPQLLRGTITAALAIDYPHRTYVLDDGRRESVRELCEELGASYIKRETNLHAKAGNLNHALEMTDGEFVVIFDADHVADRSFIDRLVGYFADERLGFVQTPHAFYNFDAYQGVLNYENDVYWEEGMLFYNVTQPGKNRWNGVSFCGSAAMFRRRSLEEVGLIATQSITEDMHTGLRMHAKGWKSLFINERLIAAIAADDVTSFNTQRLRWGEGNLGIFAFDNPLTIPGLTIGQRLCYLGSMLSWTTGVQKLLIYLSPMLMLLTDVAPVVNFGWGLAFVTGLYLLSIWAGVKIASNGYGRLWAIELTQMACFWVQTKATWRAVFNRKKASFVVTSKRGRQSNSTLRQVMPQIVYIAGSLAAILWAVTRYSLHLSDDISGPIVGSALLLMQSSMAWIVVRRALRPKERRASWRHPGGLHVNYRITKPDGGSIDGQGVTRDINETGVGLVTFEELPAASELELTVSAAGRSVTCRGEIRSKSRSLEYQSAKSGTAKAYRYGVEFLAPDKDALHLLWWLGAQYNVGRQYERFDHGQSIAAAAAGRRLPTRADERVFSLPLTLQLTEQSINVGVTETIGPETMTALLPAALDRSETVKMRLSTPFGSIQSWVEVEAAEPRSIGGRTVHETRFRYRRFSGESRSQLQSNLAHYQSKELAGVVRLRPGQRPTKSMRPAALIACVTALAATLAIACELVWRQDDAVLARVETGAPISSRQLDRLKGMVQRLYGSTKIDEPRALQLRTALMRLGQSSEVSAIDRVIEGSSPQTTDGRILKAVCLQTNGKGREAETIFVDLMEHADRLYDDRARSEVLLAAARNAANIGQYAEAAQRYEKLKQFGPLGDEVRSEYEGVLFRADCPAEAIKVIQGGPQTSRELRLMASIESSEHRFDKAIGIYRQLLADAPDDLEALRGVADNHFWAKDYAAAADGYGAVLTRSPRDCAGMRGLAESLLYAERHGDAVEAYAQLVRAEPETLDLWDEFLLAAAGAKQLKRDERRMLADIYVQRSRRSDDAFLLHLLNAIDKHGAPQETMPLYRELLSRSPGDGALRLRFADTLHDLGQFSEADKEYRWLLAHSSAQAQEAKYKDATR